MFEQDFIMRQIKLLSDSISQLVFRRRTTVELIDEDGNIQGSGVLYHVLRSMVQDGDINGAENLLFDELERNPAPDILEVALQFYSDLANLSDEQLSGCNFSRNEIEQGLREVHALALGIG